MHKAIKSELERVVREVNQARSTPGGYGRFRSLRDADSLVEDLRVVLSSGGQDFAGFLDAVNSDIDFEANSRRVRLEAARNHANRALRWFSSGAIGSKKEIYRAPDTTQLCTSMPDLKAVIDERWLDAQKCMHQGLHLCAVVLMGSILEGLLLASAQKDLPSVMRSDRAPKDRSGKVRPVYDWSLSQLIDVSVELGWIQSDRGKFSHALRESRNVVHPWQQVSSRVSFDSDTCETCFHVLKSSVKDLLRHFSA